MSLQLLSTLVWAAAAAPAPGDVLLADVATIVIPAHPNCIELRAAQELQALLPELSGATSPPSITREWVALPMAGFDSPKIYVGATAALNRSGVVARIGGYPLDPEEAIAAVAQGNLFVFGDDTNVPNVDPTGSDFAPDFGGDRPRTDACSSEIGPLPECVGVEKANGPTGCRAGTYYATTSLLRRLGVRWVWPGSDGVVLPPTLPSLAIPSGALHREAPQLTFRRLRPDPLLTMPPAQLKALVGSLYNETLATQSFHDEAVWMLRNGLGGRSSVPWGQAFMSSWDQYGAAHPEWFALQPDGTRGCQNMSDCDHNPGIVKIDPSSPGLATHVASLLDPNGSGVSACEDDSNRGFCTCEDCRSLDPSQRAGTLGAYSDRYTYFWNQVHRALRAAGHSEAWVGAYAYENYTFPPLVQRFDNESKVLILSVGFGSVLDWDNSTTDSRQGWQGWVEAGAAGMAMRPNSLWADYTGLPFVFSDQWIDDVVWCGQHRMSAADFDSLVGDYAAVGPSYYLLARTLFNPATANLSAIRAEYYSAYGSAAGEVESYIGYWQSWAQKTYTDPKVAAQIRAYQTKGSKTYIGDRRAQWVMAPELYTPSVLSAASTLLARAEESCGDPAAPACRKVGKFRSHLNWTKGRAGAPSLSSDCTLPIEAQLAGASELLHVAESIAGAHVVNVYFLLATASHLGDLLGTAAAAQAPPFGSDLAAGYLISTQLWYMALDPSQVGVSERWYLPGLQKNWSRTAVGCVGGCTSGALEQWAEGHNGTAYSGLSWWSVSGHCNQVCCAPFLGDNRTTALYLRDAGGAESVTAWFNGVRVGGCADVVACQSPLILPIPPALTAVRGGVDVLVLAVNATVPGLLPRVFAVRPVGGLEEHA